MNSFEDETSLFTDAEICSSHEFQYADVTTIHNRYLFISTLSQTLSRCSHR